MLSAVLYLGLGVFDALSVLVLALKMYRLPLWEYRYRLLGVSALISAVSYLNRIVLGIPGWDMIIQIVLFILFFRYAMQIKVFYSALIVSAGFNAYILLQLLVFYAFVFTGSMTYSVIYQSEGGGIQLIQIITILLAYLFAGGMKLFNQGFSFIISPPHDFNIKEAYTQGANGSLLVAVILALILGSLALVVAINYNTYLLILSSGILFGLSYYLSYRKEKSK